MFPLSAFHDFSTFANLAIAVALFVIDSDHEQDKLYALVDGTVRFQTGRRVHIDPTA